MKPTERLNQQLKAMMATLAEIPETDMPGNAAYYLNRVVQLVADKGVDEPLVTSYWHFEDLDWLLCGRADAEGYTPTNRDYARKLFALVSGTHNAEIGINWDVLRCASECLTDGA
jgi:hypothetical protein